MTPRGAWLAIGAVVAALLMPAIGSDLVAVAIVGLASAAGCLVALRVRRPSIRIALVTAGALAVLIRSLVLPPPPSPVVPVGDGPWTATVETASSPRDGSRSVLLSLEPDERVRVAARLPLVPAVDPGARIEVTGALEPVPDSAYGAYLTRIGAVATLEGTQVRLLDAARTDPTSLLAAIRRSAGDALEAAIPEPAAGLAAGIVVGQRERVDRDVAAAFTTAGVSHVVAISGWNIAIVAATVARLAGPLRRRRRVVVILVVVALYTLFAGATASVVRAAVMATVVLLARESGRPAAAAAALGWAVTLLVLVDPAMAADVGFQLSVLGTAGLVWWADPLGARLRAVTRGRLPGPLVESLAISLAAQAATLPIVLATFGRLATVAPAVNLLVIPLIPPAMAAALLALVGGLAVTAGVPAVVGILAGLPAWALLSIVIGIVTAAAGMPGASLALDPALGTIVGLVSAVAIGVAWRQPWRHGRKGRRAAARTATSAAQHVAGTTKAGHGSHLAVALPPRTLTIGFVALAVLGTSAASAVVAAPDGALRVTVLDVGQGDAILLEGPGGSRMLVDGGPDPDRLAVRLDERLPPWDRRLDTIVLTHPHEDHVAGLLALMARYRVDHIYEPGMRGRGPGYEAWRERLAAARIATKRLGTGDRLSLDDLTLRVLWPDREAVPTEPADDGTAVNNVSIVLLGTIGRQRFLLTGDIEDGIDPILLRRGLPRVDLLKVAHHGSRTSSTTAFLREVDPTIAVVSAGRGNPYGHPTKATLARLEASGADVLRTDEDGSVTVRLDGRTISRGATHEREPSSTGAAPRASSGPNRVLASGLGCVVPRRTATLEGAPRALGYHRPDEAWHRPRAELGSAGRLAHHDRSPCDAPRLGSTVARIRARSARPGRLSYRDARRDARLPPRRR